MSETPPKEPNIRVVSKDPKAALDRALERFFDQETEVDAELKTSREDTRNHITKVILWAFAAFIILFSASLCYLSVWGDINRIPVLLEATKTVASIVTPIVTFVLGFYYATKAAN